jgi:hypothetical protein
MLCFCCDSSSFTSHTFHSDPSYTTFTTPSFPKNISHVTLVITTTTTVIIIIIIMRSQQAQSIPSSHHLFSVTSLDVVRVRSTDSTEPAHVAPATKNNVMTPPRSAIRRANGGTLPQHQLSWRTKDQSPSHFRTEPSSSQSWPSGIPDLLTIGRSLAFDDDSDDEGF